MSEQDRDLVLACCQLEGLSDQEEEFVVGLSVQVLELDSGLSLEQREQALALTEKYK